MSAIVGFFVPDDQEFLGGRVAMKELKLMKSYPQIFPQYRGSSYFDGLSMLWVLIRSCCCPLLFVVMPLTTTLILELLYLASCTQTLWHLALCRQVGQVMGHPSNSTKPNNTKITLISL